MAAKKTRQRSRMRAITEGEIDAEIERLGSLLDDDSDEGLSWLAGEEIIDGMTAAERASVAAWDVVIETNGGRNPDVLTPEEEMEFDTLEEDADLEAFWESGVEQQERG